MKRQEKLLIQIQYLPALVLLPALPGMFLLRRNPASCLFSASHQSYQVKAISSLPLRAVDAA